MNRALFLILCLPSLLLCEDFVTRVIPASFELRNLLQEEPESPDDIIDPFAPESGGGIRVRIPDKDLLSNYFDIEFPEGSIGLITYKKLIVRHTAETCDLIEKEIQELLQKQSRILNLTLSLKTEASTHHYTFDTKPSQPALTSSQNPNNGIQWRIETGNGTPEKLPLHYRITLEDGTLITNEELVHLGVERIYEHTDANGNQVTAKLDWILPTASPPDR